MTSRTPIATRRHTAAAVLLTAVVLMGTACTAGQPPPPAGQPSSQSPSAPSAVSPSATPTPSASYKPADAAGKAQNVPVPVLPEAARAETKEGLEAFAKYWFELLSYGYETGDVQPLNSVTSVDCEPCAKAIKVIQAWNTEGRWLVGGTLTTPAVSTEFAKGADALYQVAVQAHQKPLTYMRQDGSVARSDPPPNDTGNLLFASFVEGAWRLVNIGRIVG